jgi:hypothetical protein
VPGKYVAGAALDRPDVEYKLNIVFLGFEVLTAVDVKSLFFRYVTPCSSVKAFDIAEEHRLNIQGQSVSQVRNQHKISSKL